jgi:hypothetical protein
VRCEVRSDGHPPLALKVEDLTLWRRVSTGESIGQSIMAVEVEYLPSNPSRVRYLPYTNRRSLQVHVHHLRGVSHVVVALILVAIGLLPLYHGVRLISRNRARRLDAGGAMP